MTFFVISVLFVNIILWAIMLIRFKRLFSTDKIVEKTEQQLNHLIKEIDMAADRDTYLAKETSKRIKNQIEEAEQKMELFNQATNRLRDMVAEADKINKGQKYKIYSHAYDYPPQALGKNARIKNSVLTDGCMINGEITHSVISYGVVVDENANIIDSVILPNVKIGRGVTIKNAIVDEGLIIKDDMNLVFDEPTLVDEDYLGGHNV